MATMLQSRGLTVLMHVLLWVSLLAVPSLLGHKNLPEPPGPHSQRLRRPEGQAIAWPLLPFVGLFYLNAFVLMPKLVPKRRRLYALALLGCLITVAALQLLVLYHLDGPPFFNWRMFAFTTFIGFVFFGVASASYRIILDRVREERLRKERENENLKTELAFLRWQVSPHFLFNVLNGIVALSRRRPEKVEPALLGLSELMRYMLYAENSERITMEREAAYLRSYLDLQLMRLGEGVRLDARFEITDPGRTIEPMLLVPFVENAFKHGTGFSEAPEIQIGLACNANEGVRLQVCNPVPEGGGGPKDDTPGIGVENARRRLELLYPGRHTLRIDVSGGWYCVTLNIE